MSDQNLPEEIPPWNPSWNPDHLEIVEQGIEAIEAWRWKHPHERLNLAGANFINACLGGAFLQGANLEDTSFICAHLEEADLSYTSLERSFLTGAHLEQADLTGAHLEGASLSCAKLNRAKMVGAHLEGAELLDAELEGTCLLGADLKNTCLLRANLRAADLSTALLEAADLRDAHLEGANLQGAGLKGTDLTGAHLEGANLSSADLKQAQLVEANLANAKLFGVGLVPLWRRILLPWQFPFKLDFTRIRDTQFEPKASDPWSILRRNYTGPQFALHLLFLLLFALPFFARSLYWRGMNEVQEIGYKAAVGQVRMAANHLRDSPGARAWVQEADGFLERHADAAEGRLAAYRELREVLESATKLESAANLLDPASLAKERLWASEAKALLHLPLLREEAHERSMWELLIGLDKGLFYFLLVLLPVILYNLLRAWLTYKVSLLRDAEERSGYSPRWSDYGWLYWLHQPARLLLLAASIAFVFNAWHWLTESVVVSS